MGTRRASRGAQILCGLALAGLLAGCGAAAGPSPNAGGPTAGKTIPGGPGAPNQSGVYHAGRRVARKTDRSARSAARAAKGAQAGKSAGRVYRGLAGSARKTAQKTGGSATRAGHSLKNMGTGAPAKSSAPASTGSHTPATGGAKNSNRTHRRTPKNSRMGASSKVRRAATHRHGSWIFSSSSVAPMSLTTLPPLPYVQKLNPWLKHAHQISSFIPGMGYHWATPYPGLVLMTNQAGAVTAVEASFPQKLGQFSWWDPPTTQPNGGIAFNSEHLYFVTPSSITPTMTSKTSDLGSWSAFRAVNTRLASYVREPSPLFGFTVYGPPVGPGIKVLVNKTGIVSGFVVEEPAVDGHYPGYYPARRRALFSREFGHAYDSVLLLTPVKQATP